jgi:Na+-driven multidrug efflux pump
MSYEYTQDSAWRRAVRFFRHAIRDNETDFTVGPIGRSLGLLAIPMVLEMSMESIFAVVDIAFVSRLGTNAVAAVGITEALITILYAVAIGLGMGITAMVSRRIGEKEPDDGNRLRFRSTNILRHLQGLPVLQIFLPWGETAMRRRSICLSIKWKI